MDMLGKKSSETAGTNSTPERSGPIGPMAAAQSVSVGDFQSIVDEAAIIFASGDEKAAAEMLVRFLSQTKGNADKRVWYMLLDIYHAMGKREEFDQFALHFANRFGASPPSWGVGVEDNSATPLAPAAPGAKGASGANVLILEGGISGSLMAKAKDFIAAGRQLKTCKIDISRLKMEQSTADGFACLQNIMAQMRKYKVAGTLMGENHVANALKKIVEASKESKDPSHSQHWLMLLEILQWRGMETEFEDLSFEYTVTFEVSGPGWEPDGVMNIEAVAEITEEEAEKESKIIPDSLITDMSIQKMQGVLQSAIKEKGEARIDFSHVERMEFSSAGTFTGIVMSMGVRPEKIIIDSPSELIVALMDVVGLSPLVSISPRKR